MQGVRLPFTTALLGVALVAGCSSGGAAPISSAPPNTTPRPGKSSDAGPVGLPIAASPTPSHRAVGRPPGAKVVDFETCGVVTDIVRLYLRDQVFGANSRALQQEQLADIGGLLDPQIRLFGKARATWLADGYPASFPVVRDLARFLSIYERLHQAARTRDVDAVPDLYAGLDKVTAQYFADTNADVCEQ